MRHGDVKGDGGKTGDVLGEAAWRIYRAIPVAVYNYDDAAGIVHGQHVDVRVKVTLEPSG